MNRLMLGFALTLLVPLPLLAQQQSFKLGTFEDAGETYLGMVLDDARVVNIARANDALPGVKPSIPRDMTDLIVRYEALKSRLYAIAEAAASSGAQAAYIKDVHSVRILPPLTPNISYNAAANYSLHAAEMARRGGADPDAAQAPAPDPIPGIWEREAGDTRQNPYVFLKAASTVIADGEAIHIPPQREAIDWECELAVVIGAPASRVPAARAQDYIFGYTLENDVSDRGGRGDGRMGSDWFLQKNHDTFAPLGPFIVPKEFVADPHNLRQTFTLSGKSMQDANTGHMTHNSFEMLAYISNIVTLHPGDIISMGSPPGVGTARETPIYMKHGDTAVCTIESIGTLTNPVVDPSL
jgi:2-keto-4-pentenoate hydratase/2-oxohepta-3-ene-1,7-dioic acid hydratase in catechol pathway